MFPQVYHVKGTCCGYASVVPNTKQVYHVKGTCCGYASVVPNTKQVYHVKGTCCGYASVVPNTKQVYHVKGTCCGYASVVPNTKQVYITRKQGFEAGVKEALHCATKSSFWGNLKKKINLVVGLVLNIIAIQNHK